MVESLLKFITEQKLFRQEDHLLLAVSGGIDSMVMAQLFLNAGIPFGIAHVNYNLRGSDSIGDRDCVMEWGDRHGLKVHVKNVEASTYESKESIQMIARRIRYDYFESLMGRYGYTRLATAHHLNDSFETILLNLVKGTGPRGLKGIPVRNGYVIRPMMFTDRKAIHEYAKTYDVHWREDSSNSKSDYQRNHIRHQVSPLLEEINPSLLETFKDTKLRMQGALELLAEEVEKIKKGHLEQKSGYESFSTGWMTDSKKSLLLLSEIMSDYGLNFSQVKDLFACVLERSSGKVFKTSTHQVSVDREQLLINLLMQEKEGVEFLIHEGQDCAQIDGGKLTLETVSGKEPYDQGEAVVLLDADKLIWPLKIRSWQQGDRFMPLGMMGKKMVSDFMIDRKIPVKLKEEIKVLESSGDIVWLIGHRLDERFKVTSDTVNIMKISFRDAQIL